VGIDTVVATSPVGWVVVTGVTASDVTVWLGANLAISLAGAGRRVLLVDARMGTRFGRPAQREPDTAGLYDVLNGALLATGLSPGPAAGLSVLPSGAWDIEPAQTLIDRAFARVMGEALEQFDVAVVLAPPLDACDDARAMVLDGGALLLTIPEGEVTHDELRVRTDRVQAAGARLLGVVLVRRRPHRHTTTSAGALA